MAIFSKSGLTKNIRARIDEGLYTYWSLKVGNNIPSKKLVLFKNVTSIPDDCQIHRDGSIIQENHVGDPTNFFLATSTNVGTSPQNFLTFSFNPFPTPV